MRRTRDGRRFRAEIGRGLVALEPRMLPSADVLTYHNDNQRTGANLDETVLNPSNVNAATFGKLGQVPVDGQVYAQPLVKTNVTIPGQGVHNVVYVATENDSVYAFDADTLALLWHDSFINPAAGITAVPSGDLRTTDIFPQVGITSTPVIDAATNRIYVVSDVKVTHGRSAHYVPQLHALDLGTGAETLGGPAVIGATIGGRGTGSAGGRLTFNPKIQNQRSALLLENGVVYIAWASYSDHGPYHGWVMGYNAQTLQRVAAFNATPNGSDGGIWMSADGLAADASGALYLSTGNGTFDANRRGHDYGDTVLKLNPNLTVADTFTPANQAFLSKNDKDLDSGGTLILPDQPGTFPHLLITGGKQGTLYLIDRDALGGYNTGGDHIVGEIPGALKAQFDTPAYFNGTLYYVGTPDPTTHVKDTLKAFRLVGDTLAAPTSGTFTYGYPGSTPSVSADGTADGIVWTLDNGAQGSGGPAILRANDASDITHELYDSTQNAARDVGGLAVKFTVPTVANGKVYVGGGGTLTLYGLLATEARP